MKCFWRDSVPPDGDQMNLDRKEGSVMNQSWDGMSPQAQLDFSRLVLPDPNATVEQLWGETSSDLYGVGNAGTIVRYVSNTWEQIETGATIDVIELPHLSALRETRMPFSATEPEHTTLIVPY